MTWVALGLGSNKGDRAAHLRSAVTALKAMLETLRCSPVYETPALLPPVAPQEWDKAFLNMAVSGDCTLAPLELLKNIKSLEAELGRKPSGHWGPREIDIDILAYGARRIQTPELTVPHKELLHRDFALLPLADIAPDWIYPAQGKTARELAAAMQSALQRTDWVIVA